MTKMEIVSWVSTVDDIHELLATGGGREIEPAAVQAALVALERLHETLLWAEVRAVVRGPIADARGT